MALILALAVALAAALLGPASAVSDPQDAVVSDDPVQNTPHALDGRVYAIMPVGDRVVVGGTFTQIREQNSTTVLDRRGIFAFDPETGEIDNDFQPVLNGDVETLAAAPDGNSVYIGGAYSQVNGVNEWRLTRLNMADGSIDPTFQVTPNSKVRDIVLAGDRLYVGGMFTRMDNEVRTAFAALDPETGDVDPDVNFTLSGQRRGTIAVFKLDVTPDHNQVVVIGNFGQIDGQPRSQVALFDVGYGEAQLANWATTRYGQFDCASVFDSPMRDVEVSPDGAYMVIVTTGAYRRNTLCDSAARWDLDATGSGLEPTWADLSGGDTFYSTSLTGEAVYLGGHFRWLNNPWAADFAGPGAVSREGIGAADPVTGLPLSWNPGRTRGVGAFDLVATDDGLYVGSDTDRIGNYEYHGRLARFPLAGGSAIAAADPGPLPGTLFNGSGSSLIGRSFDGTTVGASAGSSVSWSGVRAAMMLSGRLYTASTDGQLRVRDFDGTTAGTPETIDLNGLTSSYFPVSSLRGMTFDPLTGRLYYTVSGRNELFYRLFTAESNTVGGTTFVASTSVAGIGGQYLTGMHLHDNHLYFSATDGYLRRADFVDGVAVANSVITVDGPNVTGTNWSGAGLFLQSDAGYDAPNALPEPVVRSFCEGGECRFGSTGSGDADGWVETFTWDFGDGTTAAGPGVTHEFGDGTFTVTLTATDNEGGQTSTSSLVTVDGPPAADAAISCANLACTMDGSGSLDSVSYAWDFGDGTTGGGVIVDHTYAAAGTYTVSLTVTDDTGLTDTVTEDIQVSQVADEITHLGTEYANGNQQSFIVDVPDATRGGDLMLLFGSFSNDTANPTPAELSGWTQLDSITAGPLRSSVWWRIAEPGDEERTETLNVGTFMKGDVAIVSYAGTSTSVPVAAAAAVAETVNSSTHTTPTITNGLDEATVVSYWADRTGSNSDWTEPAGSSVRHEGIGSGGGRISALVTDMTAVPGEVGGVTATSVTTTNRATAWTIVLSPFGVDTLPDLPPTAAAVGTCVRLVCTVDGSDSSDPDGEIANYSWDMGDNTTLAGPVAEHTYAADGTYTATLTVTDSAGQIGTTTVELTATAPADGVTFTGATSDNGNQSAFWVDIPDTVVADDLLLLTASFNNSTVDPNPINLPGWTRIDSVTTSRVRTTIWYRIADTADAGQTEVLDVGQFVKGDVALLAYEGVDTVNPIEIASSQAETAVTSDHISPTVDTLLTDGMVISLWADRNAATTDWIEPAGTTVRHEGIGSGGGRVSGLITEALTGAPGTVGGQTATADDATRHATMWTIVLSPS